MNEVRYELERGVDVRSEISEKQRIELATLNYFLPFFNIAREKTFMLARHGDAPDFLLTDDNGNEVYVEATLSDDREDDMAVLLGRRESRRPGPHRGIGDGDFSTGEPLARLCAVLEAKLEKRYGGRGALVLRMASPASWDLRPLARPIRERLGGGQQPYSEGVWIVTFRGEECIRVL